jgi:hypothetical protein
MLTLQSRKITKAFQQKLHEITSFEIQSKIQDKVVICDVKWCTSAVNKAIRGTNLVFLQA